MSFATETGMPTTLGIAVVGSTPAAARFEGCGKSLTGVSPSIAEAKRAHICAGQFAPVTLTRVRGGTIGCGSPPLPTHTAAVMQLDSGVLATLIATFEAPGHYASSFLVLGADGSISLPDPNRFDGKVGLRQGACDWADSPYHDRGSQEARGIGLAEMAIAVGARRAPRASGALAHHVVDVGRSILAAATSGSTVVVGSTVARPDPLPVSLPAAPIGTISA